MEDSSVANRDLFKPREHLEPAEYPECESFVDAINNSFWTRKEWSFQEDLHLYHTVLTPYQKDVVRKCLLLISQVEVSVKTFWANIYRHFPKPEFNDVGVTFGESEVRHQKAYSHLLKIMGLQSEFENIYNIPAVVDRHNYLSKYKEFATARLDKNYVKALVLFSLFIENVSLFSQFFIVQSFNKHRKQLKDISNAISATSKEEAVHGQFGTWVINVLREEHPEFFTTELEEMIVEYSHKSYAAEKKLLKWILDQGDVTYTDDDGEHVFISVDEVDQFIRKRLNTSLEDIGLDAIFDIDQPTLKRTEWFDEEILSGAHVDFFHQRPTSYSRKNKAITADTIF
jgi:ribonucleoside-diphosphate reductase beta chain